MGMGGVPVKQREPTVVVLAAGSSTRFGRPKQWEPVGPAGETLLDYALFDASRAGFRRAVLVVPPGPVQLLSAELTQRWGQVLQMVLHPQRLEDLDLGGETVPDDLRRRWCATRKKPWGTAHALLSAARHLAGPFVVLNADDFYGLAAFREGVALAGTLEETDQRTFGLVAYRLADTLSAHGGVNRGICRVGEGGWLEGILEGMDLRWQGDQVVGRTADGNLLVLSGQEPVSTNFWVFTPALFPLLEEGFRAFLGGLIAEPDRVSRVEFLLPDEMSRALSEGKVRVRVRGGGDFFLGLTHPQDLEEVRAGLAALVRAGDYPSPLWESVGKPHDKPVDAAFRG